MSKLVLLHGPAWDGGAARAALDAEQVERRVVTAVDAGTIDERPTVLLLDEGLRAALGAGGVRAAADAGAAIVALGAPGETDLPEAMPGADLAPIFLTAPVGTRQLLAALKAAFREAAGRAEILRGRAEVAARSKEIAELTQIGVALTTERNYDVLLEMILSQARRITQSDGGSLYLVEGRDTPSPKVRFKLAQNDTVPKAPFVELTMPLNHASIGGYVCATGETVVIDDAYFLPPDVEYSINRSFDERNRYRSKSMLTVPMKNHKNETIGALQLINRKRDPAAVLSTPEVVEAQVIPFSRRTVEIVNALAGQAAVSIENSLLYEDIERLFEGFVTAAVTAIEQRDPTTFGHSGRVATMTVGLAEVVDRAGDGPYRSVRFSREQLKEIRYAGLLHDFGKVGVREQVLVKAKKLYPPDLALLRSRYAFIRRTAESEYHRRRAEWLLANPREDYERFLASLDAEHRRELEDCERFLQTVLQSNEPTLLPEGSFEELLALAERRFTDIDGSAQPYLSDDEVRFLTIRKGSLDEAERLEIESHVSHTYRFLLQIPWTKELSHIPLIAYGHHEKLDGKGYPRKVRAAEIPVQTRMMTISDIFDALTAADRPYKRAVPLQRALDIMRDEVKGGMLDGDLFGLFVEGKVFEKLAEDTAASS
ncbi:MAG TPA: HD domain-containing phosphohydrolase [Gemmatimonadales bacterium]|nr:HD domain-containing phosphohydrolase [Gemmatimonadales bacterium]